MEINVMQLLVICVFAGLAYWANDKLNNVPALRTVIQVVIVVAAVFLIFQSLGIINNGHVRVTT
ncbi:MAG: hypothetical protein JNN05_07090 [Candidatus Omnitrophica bacterium]|nr:hypothetical protein [Candidatus Omnitrophota bacterium]